MSEKLNLINTKIVSFSLALVSGIVYLLCAFFFAIAPQTALNLFKNMFHGIDITKIASGPVPLGNIVIGFAEIIIFSLAAGWLFAVCCNYLLDKKNENKKMKQNNLALWLTLALVIGGLVGFFIGERNQIFSPKYVQETASMMGGNGQSMMQMGNMMMNMGQMMQQKSDVHHDDELMQKGKELEESGKMIQNKGTTMMDMGKGMMGMMK